MGVRYTSSGANNSVHTSEIEYVVWLVGDTPQTGWRVMAKSAFDARRKRARELGLSGVSALMARMSDRTGT